MTQRPIWIIGSLVGFSISLLLPDSALAQKADCNQIEKVFGIADWQTLATGPFVDKRKNQAFADRRALAKPLLKGLDKCVVWNAQSFTNKTESYSYTCYAPRSTARGKNFEAIMSEVKALAAPWRSCFGGWTESSDGGDYPELASAVLRFEKADQKVTFGRFYYFKPETGDFESAWMLFTRGEKPLRMNQ